MTSLLLLALALLPPVLFLLRLLSADAREPEPLDMVLFAFALGVVSTLPASLIELAIGLLPGFPREGLAGAAFASFVQVAPAEEGCKLAVVLLFIWKNRNFNEENDGIVYVTASAIGFALLENVLYVFGGDPAAGITTGIARALTSIPLHTFCGVLMGHYVGRARFAATRTGANALVLGGFAVAWFVHGLYDTFALANATVGWSAMPIVSLVFALFVVGDRFMKDGQRRSAERWGGTGHSERMVLDTGAQIAARLIAKYGESKIGVDADGNYFLRPERQTWKAAAGWTLLGLSALTCAVIFLSLGRYGSENPTILFVNLAAMTTGVPITLGILLLYSYRRRLAGNHYF